MANWNTRRVHRLLVPIAAAPLLLTAITGSVFGALDSRGIAAEWLLELHQGKFGNLALSPYYSVLLGICTLVIVISGIGMLLPKKRKGAGVDS
jgi:uncharacterized iron-regulated membrane protein